MQNVSNLYKHEHMCSKAYRKAKYCLWKSQRLRYLSCHQLAIEAILVQEAPPKARSCPYLVPSADLTCLRAFIAKDAWSVRHILLAAFDMATSRTLTRTLRPLCGKHPKLILYSSICIICLTYHDISMLFYAILCSYILIVQGCPRQRSEFRKN